MFDGTIDQYKFDFLLKTLAFGHLNLCRYSTDEFKTISLEALKEILGNRKAERWLLQLLQIRKERGEGEILLLHLTENSIYDRFNRLFFSEQRMFQFYCETQSLPLLNLKDNARVSVITSLPDHLLDLKPKNFWQKWASISLNIV